MLQAMLEILLFGLSDGMVLFLVAAGLTITFGVLKVINFAHGSFYMLGAYYTFLFYQLLGGQFWVAVIIATILVAITGGILERVIFRPIYDHDHIYQLLLTFALVLVLDNGVRMIAGGQFRAISTPELFQWQVFPGYPSYQGFLLILGLLTAGAIYLSFERTLIGKTARAAAERQDTASALGVNVRWLYTGIFVGGTALAGFAGAISTPYVPISPMMGEHIIIDAFIVVIVGGLGSFSGAFVGAILLGVLQTAASYTFPALEQIVPYLLLAIVLLIRPEGIFGKVEV